MKKLILALVVLCSGSAMAQSTPVQVTQECIRQMSAGICMAIPRRADLAPGATRLFSGIGRLSAYAYQDYMDLYNEQVPSDPAMCSLALDRMTVDPAGDHAKIARALWTPSDDAERQTDPAVIAAAALASIMLGASAAALALSRKQQEKAGV